VLGITPTQVRELVQAGDIEACGHDGPWPVVSNVALFAYTAKLAAADREAV
jgi:hypothetical protein